MPVPEILVSSTLAVALAHTIGPNRAGAGDVRADDGGVGLVLDDDPRRGGLLDPAPLDARGRPAGRPDPDPARLAHDGVQHREPAAPEEYHAVAGGVADRARFDDALGVGAHDGAAAHEATAQEQPRTVPGLDGLAGNTGEYAVLGGQVTARDVQGGAVLVVVVHSQSPQDDRSPGLHLQVAISAAVDHHFARPANGLDLDHAPDGAAPHSVVPGLHPDPQGPLNAERVDQVREAAPWGSATQSACARTLPSRVQLLTVAEPKIGKSSRT